MILHRAPFVVPVSRPVIIDGGVLVADDKIIKVGRFKDLNFESAVVCDHPETILTPPLVNCHCHLELAHLAELGQKSGPENFTGWVRELVAIRQEKVDDGLAAAARELAELEDSGVGLLADIGNLPQSAAIGEKSRVRVIFFQEMLGLAQDAARENIRLLAKDSRKNFTAHAPYSCAAVLLKAIKEKARQQRRIFSIHAAESLDEKQFLSDASGPMRDFVEDKGAWDNSFVAPGCGTINYLNRLDILDERTLCVHCVHVSEAEIAIIAAKKAKICLCPGSNKFLGVGKAPVSMILKQGIMPGLGTDSLAGNLHCSIWEEMRILSRQQPDIDPALIFTMATRGGAEALGYKQYGMLEPDNKAAMLAVSFKQGREKEVLEFLTLTGKDIRIRWIR